MFLVTEWATGTVGVERTAESRTTERFGMFYISRPVTGPTDILYKGPGLPKRKIDARNPWTGLFECLLKGREIWPLVEIISTKNMPLQNTMHAGDRLPACWARREINSHDF